jgi:hypothetical protein
MRQSARTFAERNLDAKAMNQAYEQALRSLLPTPEDTEHAEALGAFVRNRR